MIHAVCREIITGLRINRFVETGTFVGETIARVADWFSLLDRDFGTIAERKANDALGIFFAKRTIRYPVFSGSRQSARTKVYSVDIDNEKQALLSEMFSSNPNITFVNRPSVDFIREAIDVGVISDNDNSFFYLDAHWGKNWPLRDEIRQVLRLKRSVIAIDDSVVPYHPFHGFDAYRTTVCEWYHIRNLFSGRSVRVYYPRAANDDRRGTIIIFVGYQEDELLFLRNIPLFTPVWFRGAPVITLSARLILAVLLITGLYGPLLRFYLARKWGSAENAPMDVAKLT